MKSFNHFSLALTCSFSFLMTPSLVSQATSLITNQPDITLHLTAGDDNSGIAMKQFRLIPYDWKGWTTYDPNNPNTPTNIITDGGKEGHNDYVAIVKDLAENQSTTVTRRVLLDLTGPTMESLSVSPIWTNKNEITVKATATDNYEPETKVKTISLSNDNQFFTSITAKDGAISTKWSIPLVDGTQTLYAKATDDAGTGNTGGVISTTYHVDTVSPIGGVSIENGGDYIPSTSTSVSFKVEDLKTAENNRSTVSTVRLFDVHGPGSYTFDFKRDSSLKENTEITVPWELATTIDAEGMETGQVGIEITDVAGNKSIEYSQVVIVSKIVANKLCINEVVNPKDYPSSNPFTPVCYNNLTGVGFQPIPMLMGGSFKFKIDYTAPATAAPTWTVSSTGNIEYTDSTYTLTKTFDYDGLNVIGYVEHQEITPYPSEVPETSLRYGMKVYLDTTLEIYDTLGRKLGFDFLPRPQGTSLLIGYIDGDIREYIKFNEIN